MKKKRSKTKCRTSERVIQTDKTKNTSHYSIVTTDTPMPVLITNSYYQDVQYSGNNDYWEVPIDRLDLANLATMCAQHGGLLKSRANMLMTDYRGGGLNWQQMLQAFYDFLLFGDVAIAKIRNGWGEVIELLPLPSMYLRRNKEGEFVILEKENQLIYHPDDIIFLRGHDPQQQIYGLPDYISGMHAALLNAEANIFRRRYYHNGAHLGGIVVTSDPAMTDEMEDEVADKIEESKGIGNFKMMYMNITGAGEKAVQYIPIGDLSAKDEFANVKNITAQDVLTAHRFPAGLAGIIPQDGAPMGDPEKARDVYRKDEVTPLQRLFVDAVNQEEDIPYGLQLQFSSVFG